MEAVKEFIYPDAYSWRPYASPNNIAIPKSLNGKQYYFIIDPWTQHWIIGDKNILQLTQHMDGKTRMSEIIRRSSSCDDSEYPENGFYGLAQMLLEQQIIYNNELEHRKSGYPVYNKTDMTGFHLEITNACNMTCEHCYVSSGKKLPGELTLEEFKKTIDMLEPFSGKKIAISGGEPAASKDCIAIVEYCAITCGHDVDLYTNGKKFPRRIAERVVAINKLNQGRIRIQISLEGAVKETNDLVRGQGSFDYAMETLKMFKELGLNRHLVIFTCLTKFNIAEAKDLVKLAEHFDAELLVFSQWQRQGNAKNTPWANISPTVEQWIELGEYLLTYNNPRLKVLGNFYGDLNNNDIGRFSLDGRLFPKHLYAYNSFPRITPQGGVFADQLWVDPDWELGNVVNTTLDDCFNTPKFYQQLEDMNNRLKNISECKQCVWKELCKCGSPGHTYAEYGHMNEKDLFCDSRKYWFNKYVDYHWEKAVGK